MTQSKEFQDFDKFSLQDCFRAALEQEGIGMVSEAVNMTATATPKVMAIHDEQDESEHAHHHEKNEVTKGDDNGRAKIITVGSVVTLVILPDNILETHQKETSLSLIQ